MNTKSKTFKFGLNDDVLILCNKDEIGKVVARAEYTSSDPRYLIRQREARKILRTKGHRPSLYRLARHIIGQHPASPYASWATL